MVCVGKGLGEGLGSPRARHYRWSSAGKEGVPLSDGDPEGI